jgi:hypothetical protein
MNLETEKLITFAQAARRLPSLRLDAPVSPSTLFRWSQRGLLTPTGDRVKLETRRFGRTHITSVEALDRFFAAINGANNNAPAPRSPAERNRASAAAAKKLDAIGFGVSRS